MSQIGLKHAFFTKQKHYPTQLYKHFQNNFQIKLTQRGEKTQELLFGIYFIEENSKSSDQKGLICYMTQKLFAERSHAVG